MKILIDFLLILFIPVFIILIADFIFKKSRKRRGIPYIERSSFSKNDITKQSVKKKDLDMELWLKFHSDPVVNEHYNNIKVIKSYYSDTHTLENIYSSAAEKVIELCKKDISIIEKFINIHKKYNQELPPNYYSFKVLAMLYEKRGKYEKAIDVCETAIKYGYSDDGTKYGMQGRIQRLKALALKSHK